MNKKVKALSKDELEAKRNLLKKSKPVLPSKRIRKPITKYASLPPDSPEPKIDLEQSSEKSDTVEENTNDIPTIQHLIQRIDIVFSVLSFTPHKEALEDFLRLLFGIHKDAINPGLSIDDSDIQVILDYIRFCCMSDPTSTNITQEEKSNIFLDYFSDVSGNIKIDLVSILRLMKINEEGWLDDALIDLFTDVINFLLGAHTGSQSTPLPSIVCMKHFQLQHLWCLCNNDQLRPTLDFNNDFLIKF